MPLLLAIAALGLAACGGTETPSSSSDSAGSSEPSSSEAPVAGWSETDLQKINFVIGDHELPFFDFEGAGYSYTLEADKANDGSDMLALTVNNFAYEDKAKVISTWTAGGVFIDTSTLYSSVAPGETILDGTYDDNSEVQADMAVVDAEDYVINSGTGTFLIYIFPVAISTTDWSEAVEGINDLIVDNMELDPLPVDELPEPSKPADYYLSHIVYTSSTSGHLELSLYGVEDDSYIGELKTAGWTEIPNVTSTGTYLMSQDGSLAILASFERVWNGSNLLLAFYTNSYYPSWPTYLVASGIYYLTESTQVTIPVPSFMDEIDYVYFDTSYSSYGQIGIYLAGYNGAATYLEQLIDAGFVDVDYSASAGIYLYNDPTGVLCVAVDYSATDGSTDIYLYPASDNLHKEWPAQDVAYAVETIGATDEVVVPAPTFEWNYASISNVLSTYGYYEIDLKTVGTNGKLVDTSEQYAAQLNAEGSGWTYDELQKLWHNSDQKVSLRVEFDENYGLCLILSSYAPAYTSWPSEQIAAALTAMKLPADTAVVEFAAVGYLFEVGTNTNDEAYYFVITALGAKSADLATYEEALTKAGYSTSTYGSSTSSTKVWYNASGTVVVRVNYDSDAETLEIAYYEVSATVWGAWGEYVDSVATMWAANLDTKFVLPVPAVEGKTLLGYTDMSLYNTSIQLTVYVFDSTIADSYGAQLVAAGWEANASVSAQLGGTGYTLTCDNYIWYVGIMVDATNNVTTIQVGLWNYA